MITLKSILFVLIKYISYDDLVNLSKIYTIYDDDYRVLLMRDFGRSISIRDEYEMMMRQSIELSDTKREFLIGYNIDVKNISRIFQFTRSVIIYIGHDRLYYAIRRRSIGDYEVKQIEYDDLKVNKRIDHDLHFMTHDERK
jgi:hypothetical protein